MFVTQSDDTIYEIFEIHIDHHLKLACQTYSQLPNNETDAEGVSFKYPWMVFQ